MPLGVLALGAVFAGWLGRGHDRCRAWHFWAGAIFTRPGNHVLRRMHAGARAG